ncbi:MAG TPA: class I SAM-dependent methyltransferase [Thermoanaerobaculia bacterium]|nr:class I SAM-dependent methyltransferase [Thermoanaerobaculia bacterium]
MLASRPVHDAGYFDREYFQLHPGKVRYLDYLVKLLRTHGVPGGRVLDVGAGYGFFLAALEKGGYEAHGIEVSSHAVEQARRRTRGEVVEQGAEEPFPFQDAHFDAVTLLDVIEHLKDYATTLASCRRCLKPGGKLFVITLNAHSLARPLLGRRWAWYQDPTHIHMFTPRMLREGLEGAGLEVETLVTESNFCSVGEGTKFLKPLRLIGRVIHTPAFGDSLLAVAKRPLV